MDWCAAFLQSGQNYSVLEKSNTFKIICMKGGKLCDIYRVM